MRIPCSKVYRAFPELDRFDDQRCEAFVATAELASNGGAALVRVLALIVGLVGGVSSLALLVLGYQWAGDWLSHLGAWRARVESWLSEPIERVTLFVLPAACGAAAGYSVRDLWLRHAIRRQIESARCPSCRYSLLGLRVEKGTVTCPECGRLHVLAEMGKRPEDLIATP